MSVEIVLGRELHLRTRDLPPGVEQMIKDALTLPNPEREVARREHIRGWQRMPEFIVMWRDDEPGWLNLPRGFFSQLCSGLTALGHEWTFKDLRARAPMEPFGMRSRLMPHQVAAVEKLVQSQQGIYKAPPGAGKTVTSLAVSSRIAQRTLVVIDRINIAQQWRDRAEQHCGIEMGLIGDGVWDERDVTIALVQTLWSRFDALDDRDWWNSWGVVVFDEMHHVPATTYAKVASKFGGQYRFGVSATPEWTDHRMAIAEALLGPVVHETTKKELVEVGLLLRADIRVVDTQFDFAFRATSVDNTGRVQRNNYGEMMDVLAKDVDRARLVASKVLPEWSAGRSCLVVSQRLGHLRLMEKELIRAGVRSGDCLWLTGEQTLDQRMKVADVASKRRCVVLSTIANEALDIPRLSRIFLTWPTKNEGMVEQQVGRVERPHPDKTDAVAYDFRDRDVSTLTRQFRSRRGMYARNGHKVIMPERPPESSQLTLEGVK